jgi:hypothetical protein
MIRVYPAVVVLGALVTHLASEFFGMGAEADGQIIFSPRHIYLALAAFVCGVIVCREIRYLSLHANGIRDFKRIVSNSVDQLPWGGGWKFFALTAAAQFAIGVGSAIGEGCFFCGHDAFFGVAGALLTAALLALVGRLVAGRLPNLAAQLAAILLPQAGSTQGCKRQTLPVSASARLAFWFLPLANRPPPLHFASSSF